MKFYTGEKDVYRTKAKIKVNALNHWFIPIATFYITENQAPTRVYTPKSSKRKITTNI